MWLQFQGKLKQYNSVFDTGICSVILLVLPFQTELDDTWIVPDPILSTPLMIILQTNQHKEDFACVCVQLSRHSWKQNYFNNKTRVSLVLANSIALPFYFVEQLHFQTKCTLLKWDSRSETKKNKNSFQLKACRPRNTSITRAVKIDWQFIFYI